jgi:hypothetical protein
MAFDEDEAPRSTLPKKTAYKIIGVMLAATFAGTIPAEIGPFAQAVEAANPWRGSVVGKVGISILLFVTTGICLKQLNYYYKSGGGKKDGVFQTVKAYSNLEYHLDWGLGVWGAALWPVAWFYTPLWLWAFSLYCLLGILRCRYTLLRPSIASHSEIPIRPGLFSTYPGRALPVSPTDKQIRANIVRVSTSLEDRHGLQGTPVKNILAGWVWSFGIHSVVASTGFLISSILLAIGHTSISIYLTLVWVILVLVLFENLSSPSLTWGTNNADALIGRARRTDWKLIVSIAMLAVGTVVLLCPKGVITH